MATTTQGHVQYLNPEGLHKNPAFTHLVTVSGTVKTVYIGAQVAVDGAGNIVGKGDIAAQTQQILRNSGFFPADFLISIEAIAVVPLAA